MKEIKMRNKKGDMNMTLEQVIKIVLSVIGVIMFLLLIYILVFRVLFPVGVADSQAKGTVEIIANPLINMQVGETKQLEPIVSPKGWTIIGFKSDSIKVGGFQKPDIFIGKNIVCVCQKVCKKEICREIKKPLQSDSIEPFIYEIGEDKDFEVTDANQYYEMKEKGVASAGGGGSSGAE